MPASRRRGAPSDICRRTTASPLISRALGCSIFTRLCPAVLAAQRKTRIPELLELVGLAGWGSVPLGKYSKGMLQRLGLAQALIHSPTLLILDEPTDGVDPVGRRHIREILTHCEEKGVTIFINSHLLAEVEMFCREVAILDGGKVALTGKMQ